MFFYFIFFISTFKIIIYHNRQLLTLNQLSFPLKYSVRNSKNYPYRDNENILIQIILYTDKYFMNWGTFLEKIVILIETNPYRE